MALEKQNVNLPFARGVDTKTDPKQIKPGKLSLLQNGYFYTPEEIRKRNGYSALSISHINSASPGSSSNFTTIFGLWSRDNGNELLTTDGSFLYSYSSNKSKWITRTPTTDAPSSMTYVPTTLASKSIQRQSNDLSQPNSAVNGTLTAYVWDQQGVAFTSIIDTVTGTHVLHDQLVWSSGVHTAPKIFQLGGTSFLYIVWDDATSKLKFFKATDSGNGYQIAAAAAADISTANVANTPVYDATIHSSGAIYLVYREPANSISAVIIDQTGARGAGINIIATVENATALSVWCDENFQEIYFAWLNAVPRGRYTVYSEDLLTQILTRTDFTTRAAAHLTGVASTDPAIVNSLCTIVYSDASRVTFRADVEDTGTHNDRGAVYGNVVIASKPRALSGSTLIIWLFYGGSSAQNTQPTYFMVQMSAFNALGANPIIAQAASGAAGGGAGSTVPELLLTLFNTYEAALLQADRIEVTGGIVSAQNGVQALAVTIDTTATVSELTKTLHFTGGILWGYDGASMVEQNFLLYPEEFVPGTNIGGGAVPAGNYLYVAVYEWMDNLGQVHQSAPSPEMAVTVAGGATSTALLQILTLSMTNKVDPSRGKVNIAIYRTESNSTGPFYRVSSYSPNSADTQFSVGTSVTTFSDTSAATIIGNQQLYTSGGAVQNGAPPATLAVTTYKNRLIAVSAENPLQWNYSKEIVPGAPVEFSPLFVQKIDERGGNTTAADVLDDKLVFFKKKTIFIVTGDGPADNGTGNDYTPGTLLTTDTGALSAASVVAMPDGVMFQSAKGIEILGRAMTTHYVGADVESYVQGNTVVSATLIASLSQVRFLMSTGLCLVYDYSVKDAPAMPGMFVAGQWSVFTNHGTVGATLWQEKYTQATAAPTVLQETPSVFSDNGSFIQLKATTAWLSLAGIQGFQRVYKAMILGDWKSAHQLNIQVAYDFDGTITQTEAISSPSTITPYQWRILLNRQKCEAVQFTVSDSHTTANGESLRLSGLALEVGAKKGLQKSPQTQTYG